MMAEQVRSKARETLSAENTALKDRLGQKEFENNSLKSKNNNLQAEIENLTAIQAKLQSLNKKRQRHIKYLCLEVHFLKCKLAQYRLRRDEDSGNRVSSSVQHRSMAKELAEMKSLAAKQQQLICELQNRLKIKRDNLNENTHSSENQRDVSLLMNTPEDHTDETGDVDPVPDVQNRTSWFQRGKHLLRAGLSFGVSVASTLLVTGVAKMLINAMAGSGCDLNVQQNILSLHYIRPPPF